MCCVLKKTYFEHTKTIYQLLPMAELRDLNIANIAIIITVPHALHTMRRGCVLLSNELKTTVLGRRLCGRLKIS